MARIEGDHDLGYGWDQHGRFKEKVPFALRSIERRLSYTHPKSPKMKKEFQRIAAAVVSVFPLIPPTGYPPAFGIVLGVATLLEIVNAHAPFNLELEVYQTSSGQPVSNKNDNLH
jgi:hypothetical protein